MSEQYWSSCLSRTKGEALPTRHPCLPLLPPELHPLGEAHGRPGSVLNAGSPVNYYMPAVNTLALSQTLGCFLFFLVI